MEAAFGPLFVYKLPLIRPPGTFSREREKDCISSCKWSYNGSGACMGSIRPSPRVIFLNSARLTDT